MRVSLSVSMRTKRSRPSDSNEGQAKSNSIAAGFEIPSVGSNATEGLLSRPQKRRRQRKHRKSAAAPPQAATDVEAGFPQAAASPQAAAEDPEGLVGSRQAAASPQAAAEDPEEPEVPEMEYVDDGPRELLNPPFWSRDSDGKLIICGWGTPPGPRPAEDAVLPPPPIHKPYWVTHSSGRPLRTPFVVEPYHDDENNKFCWVAHRYGFPLTPFICYPHIDEENYKLAANSMVEDDDDEPPELLAAAEDSEDPLTVGIQVQGR